MERGGGMMSVQDAAAKLGARIAPAGVTEQARASVFQRVSTDTRAIAPGDLFVALKGENFDGHAYVGEAFARGAIGAIVSREVESSVSPATPSPSSSSPAPQIVVGDTTIALGRLAQFWRSRFTLPTLALTGSNGKTTVKEMLRAILIRHTSDADAVFATEGNLNNHVGVPQMMLRMRAQHRVAVFEMGMNHLLEIDYLTRLVEPDVALVIMAGTAHIGELGSREAIARAKGEIYGGLGPAGIACINLDDHFADYWRSLVGTRRVVGFGTHEDADVRGVLTADGVELSIAGEQAGVMLNVDGEHNYRNAIAAAAGAHALGVSLATIAAGLEDFTGVAGRLRRFAGRNDATIIDDSYNANPDSVRAAIDLLATKQGRRFLVLGDMGEMGVHGKQLHADIGDYVKHANLDGLFALGELTQETVMALGATGWHFDTLDELVAEIDLRLAPNVTVLVKGSRFMKMERVVEKLVPNYHGGH
jgi:UDP-N-acetylmuramoyl-tripeptide--D-alanyl-D-alanine ligase